MLGIDPYFIKLPNETKLIMCITIFSQPSFIKERKRGLCGHQAAILTHFNLWTSRLIVKKIWYKCHVSGGYAVLNAVFHTLQNIQTGSGAHPVSLSMCTGVKQLRYEVNHSPASSAEVKNEWSYSSNPPVCLHGIQRDTFTF
jgi:hypothetical protein